MEAFRVFGTTQQNRRHYLWILVIDASERSSVEQKLVKSTAIHPVRVCRNRWFLHEDNFTRHSGIDRQQPPVHESSISEVGVIDLLRRPFEYFVH